MACGGMVSLGLGFRGDRAAGRSGRTGCLGVRRLGLACALRLTDRADHVERALRIILELVSQDALAAIESVLETDESALVAGELLSGEERLSEKALEPAGSYDYIAVIW